ncbi:hypothetical protein NGM37_20525, partial [Streptomyces sp. TRM76130]|nr:hypothetical protein [Streptomyces sp. TRM76130]
RVLVRAAELDLSGVRRAALFEQLFAAVLRTAAHPRRLPSGRGAFFRRASALYAAHRPAGFRAPRGSLGV